MLTFSDYQAAAASTAIYPKERGLEYAALGLAGEAGEVANKVKKVIRDHGARLHNEHRAAIAAEIGDLLWYCAALATEIGANLEDVANDNLEKLADRKLRGVISGSGDTR